MLRFAGSCRFVFNKALALQKERDEQGEKKLSYAGLCKLLTEWRNSVETAWLADAPVHPQQQTLKDLERAYSNFFAKRADFPRFKKKGRSESFRYPDPKQIKLDQANNRLFLPKLGWLRYRNSRDVRGEVKNATEFGLFIGLPGDVDGMVHMSDIAWGISGEDALALHRKGEQVSAIVLDVDVDKERISLGMKQLEKGAPAAGVAAAASGLKKNEVVTVTVLEVRDGGLEVQAGDDGATGFIKRSDLGRDRDEQRPDRFQVGQKVDAMVTGFDRSKKPNFSIKARQLHEEKEAVEQYGSSDAGASLGDILGAALKAKKD